MSTRASTRRKRLNNTTVKNKKLKTSHRSYNKRSQLISKSQSTKGPSISVEHDNNEIDDDSSIEKDLLVIDCPDQSQLDCVSTPKKNHSRNSKKLNTKNGPLNSSVIPKHPISTSTDVDAVNVYKQLEDAISSCSPIVGRISSNTTERNVSSLMNNVGSVVIDENNDEVIIPPLLQQVTPTTNRINLSHRSRTIQSEPRINQHLSSPTVPRNIINGIRLSSNATTSSSGTKESGLRHHVNHGLSNMSRNMNGIAKNYKRSSTNTKLTSTGLKAASQFTTSFSSTNLAFLETVPEYANVKKELEQEKERCERWREDYKKLKAEFDNYRANAFPRPSVDGLEFLLQLVESLTASNTPPDSRAIDKLAESIGLTEEQLMGCRHPNPQRAALAVFSILYPTYSQRAKLNSIKIFAKKKPQLIKDIYSFARQCNPLTLYTKDKMCVAIAGSIRQAKHKINRSNNFELNVLNNDNQHDIDENDGEQRSANDNSMMDVHTQDLTNNHSRDCSNDQVDQMDDE